MEFGRPASRMGLSRGWQSAKKAPKEYLLVIYCYFDIVSRETIWYFTLKIIEYSWSSQI
jgi:hypothetical protein